MPENQETGMVPKSQIHNVAYLNYPQANQKLPIVFLNSHFTQLLAYDIFVSNNVRFRLNRVRGIRICNLILIIPSSFCAI